MVALRFPFETRASLALPGLNPRLRVEKLDMGLTRVGAESSQVAPWHARCSTGHTLVLSPYKLYTFLFFLCFVFCGIRSLPYQEEPMGLRLVS